jgi:hypothetical protein
MTQSAPLPKIQAHASKVYCPMCTHTVDALVEHVGKRAQVQAGQKCPRCSASLDAGFIFHIDRAA